MIGLENPNEIHPYIKTNLWKKTPMTTSFLKIVISDIIEYIVMIAYQLYNKKNSMIEIFLVPLQANILLLCKC